MLSPVNGVLTGFREPEWTPAQKSCSAEPQPVLGCPHTSVCLTATTRQEPCGSLRATGATRLRDTPSSPFLTVSTLSRVSLPDTFWDRGSHSHTHFSLTRLQQAVGGAGSERPSYTKLNCPSPHGDYCSLGPLPCSLGQVPSIQTVSNPEKDGQTQGSCRSSGLGFSPAKVPNRPFS